MPLPGYSGFYPGKINGETTVYAESPAKVPTKPRAEAAIPGYKGHVTGKVMYHGATFSTHNRQAVQKMDHRQVETRPGDAVRGSPTRAGYPGQGKATVAITGYGGYCPKSNYLCGNDFTTTNQKATDVIKQPSKLDWKRPSGPGHQQRRGSGASPGHKVPGYTGHVPGKSPEPDMMGQRWGAVNEAAERRFKQRQVAKGASPRSSPARKEKPKTERHKSSPATGSTTSTPTGQRGASAARSP